MTFIAVMPQVGRSSPGEAQENSFGCQKIKQQHLFTLIPQGVREQKN